MITMGLFDFFKKRQKTTTQEKAMIPMSGAHVIFKNQESQSVQENISSALAHQSTTLKNLSDIMFPTEHNIMIVPETNIHPLIPPVDEILSAPVSFSHVQDIQVDANTTGNISIPNTMAIHEHVFVDILKVKSKKNEISNRGVEPILIPSLWENAVYFKNQIQVNIQEVDRTQERFDNGKMNFLEYLDLNPFDIECHLEYVYFVFSYGYVDDAWRYFEAELLTKYPQNPFILNHAITLCSEFGDFYIALSYLNLLLDVIPHEKHNDWLPLKIDLLQQSLNLDLTQSYLDDATRNRLQQELSLLLPDDRQYDESK